MQARRLRGLLQRHQVAGHQIGGRAAVDQQPQMDAAMQRKGLARDGARRSGWRPR